MSAFGSLLDILKAAFATTVSVPTYVKIVDFILEYGASEFSRDPLSERAELVRVGYPVTYHPCDHNEKIYRGLCFGEDQDATLLAMIEKHEKCSRELGLGRWDHGGDSAAEATDTKRAASIELTDEWTCETF